MKILFILDHFHPYIGGGETLFYELTTGLTRQGNQITVITSHYDSNLPQLEIIEGVSIIRVGTNRINFQWHAVSAAIKEVKQGTYDIIHGSTYFSIIPTRLVSKYSGIKSVLTVHEIYGRLWYQFVGQMGWINYFYEWTSLTLLSFDHYICVSNYTKNCMRVMYGIPDHKLSTVYNGIDYDFRDPNSINQNNIIEIKNKYHLNDHYIGLYFGRMGLAKGMDDVLKSLPETIKQLPNYKQIFITPKKQSARLLGVKNTFSVKDVEHFIAMHNLQDHIIRLESIPRVDLKNRIGLADVVILPSRAEGFGFAVSEVCALQKNLITTNVASIPEVVYGNVNFVEPANPQYISEQVSNLHQGSHEHISPKSFTWNMCINKTINIYQSIIRGGK